MIDRWPRYDPSGIEFTGLQRGRDRSTCIIACVRGEAEKYPPREQAILMYIS